MLLRHRGVSLQESTKPAKQRGKKNFKFWSSSSILSLQKLTLQRGESSIDCTGRFQQGEAVGKWSTRLSQTDSSKKLASLPAKPIFRVFFPFYSSSCSYSDQGNATKNTNNVKQVKLGFIQLSFPPTALLQWSPANCVAGWRTDERDRERARTRGLASPRPAAAQGTAAIARGLKMDPAQSDKHNRGVRRMLLLLSSKPRSPMGGAPEALGFLARRRDRGEEKKRWKICRKSRLDQHVGWLAGCLS